MRDTKEKILKFVELGYNDCSTEFLVRLTDLETIKEALRLVPSYNNFDGELLAKNIDKIKDCISSIEFGREGSPVIYFYIPFWTSQALTDKGNKNKKFSELERENMALKVMNFAQEYFADEVNNDDNYKVRTWWD